MTDDAPAQRTIYLRAIVDVAGVLQDRPAAEKDAIAATTVGFDTGQLIVTTTQAAVATAATAKGVIAVDAGTGDTVRIYAKSGSNNFEDAVLIKDVRRTGDDEILETFAPVEFTRSAVAPGADAQAPSVDVTDQDFWFWQGAVADAGTQGLSVTLALYSRDEDGQPRFAGLYRWDLALTVKGTARPENPDEPEENPS